jgi:hypothetical protein
MLVLRSAEELWYFSNGTCLNGASWRGLPCWERLQVGIDLEDWPTTESLYQAPTAFPMSESPMWGLGEDGHSAVDGCASLFRGDGQVARGGFQIAVAEGDAD